MKKKISILLLVLVIFGTTMVNSATLTTNKSKVSINDTITVTIDFGQNIAAYDSLKVRYNPYALQYVSGDELEDAWWFDDTKEQKGIRTKTYTFKAIGSGISDITFEMKGITSANLTLDSLGDINIRKTVTTGNGYLVGDANCDGKVNSTDAAIILEMYAVNVSLLSDYNVCDVNQDGKINATDAAKVLEIFQKSK